MSAGVPAIFEQGRSVNGYIAIASAIEFGWMNDLAAAAQSSFGMAARSSVSVWLRACADLPGMKWEREHLVELLEEDDAAQEFAYGYLAATEKVLGFNAAQLSAFDFLENLRKWGDESSDFARDWVCIYKHTWKSDHAYRVLGLGVYAPFAIILTQPGLDPCDLESLLDLVDRITEAGPITLNDLVDDLGNEGLSLSDDLLHFLVLNEPSLITQCDDDIVVDRLHRALPAAHLARHLLTKDRYVAISLNRWASGENPFDLEYRLDRSALVRFFMYHDNTIPEGIYCWEEVATKIWADCGRCCEIVQGLPGVVEEVIVQCLRRAGRVLSRAEIARLIGADRLNLDPEELGPGRILAYVPGPRFATAKTCLYVLQEWVQDVHHSRNRISATRIVTPREHKDVKIAKVQCTQALLTDESFILLGVTTSRKLAHSIAVKMASRPVEPYYLNKIACEIEDYVRAELHLLGGRVIVDHRWQHVLSANEKPARQRALVLRTLKAISRHPVESDRKLAAAKLLSEIRTQAGR